jgi:hypothetical protein
MNTTNLKEQSKYKSLDMNYYYLIINLKISECKFFYYVSQTIQEIKIAG